MKKLYYLYSGMVFFVCICLGNSSFGQAYSTQIPIPDTLVGTTINLSADQEMHNFNPSGGSAATNADVVTFGYNSPSIPQNTYLGPTLVWYRNQTQFTNVTNNLNNSSTTVHWHGAHIPAWTDGGPHQPISTSTPWQIQFDINEPAATLWYHPHLHDQTYTQVEMGLSGMIMIKDANDTLGPQLPHDYNVDDFPLIIQDHVFADTGTGLYIDTTGKKLTADTIIYNTRHFMVNGIIQGNLPVPQQMVRLRILNGSSRQTYNIAMTEPRDTSNRLNFQLIASDAGYTPYPITTDSFFTGPGIRNELVYDFSQHSVGDTIYLWNMESGIPGGYVADPPKIDNALLALIVTAPTSNPVTSIPTTFPPVPIYPNPVKGRTKILYGVGGAGGPTTGDSLFSINRNQFNLQVINDTINLGDTEAWHIKNVSTVAHPFHIHDISFEVTEVKDSTTGQVWTPNDAGFPIEYLGPQDNIMVPKNYNVTFVTTFSDYGTALGGPNAADSAYMYHCHILTHEDGYYGVSANQTLQDRDAFGMMQQFVVWNGIVARDPALTLSPTIEFFPNPANESVSIKGESKKASEFCMFDLQGKMVLRQEFAPFNGTKSFDVAHLPSGMYLVEWRSAGEYANKKIVISR